MPNNKKPETCGELLDMVDELTAKLETLRQNLQAKASNEPIPSDGEAVSTMIHAALVLVVPSEQWGC